MSPHQRYVFAKVSILFVIFQAAVVCADEGEHPSALPSDLTELSLGNLLALDLVVTSPGRKPQALSDVPSAVYVISQREIAQSGATHLAELLRGVPGVSVAQVSSNKWAIGIRGFNQVFAHRVLVLEDGMSVFSPTTNGVYWETEDISLDTIDRIEIIRGPGAVLWGENAVNGVINIITKHASETKGLRVQGGAGNILKGLGEVRYGDALSDTSAYRVFARHVERGSNENPLGGSALDNWTSTGIGGRLDANPSTSDEVTFLADGQIQHENSLPLTPALDPPYVDGEIFRDDDAQWRTAKGMGDWRHRISDRSNIQIKLSALYKERVANLISFDYQTYTLEAQHHYQVASWNDLLYGGSIRFFRNSADGTVAQEVDPATRTTWLENGFVQDEVTLAPELAKLVLGAKFEHNDHTGFEVMPNVRFLYTPTRSITAWGAISRATATPAIFFEDTRIPVAAFPLEGSPIPGVATLIGNRDLESETLIAYELGTRAQLSTDLFADLSLFYNDYDDVFSQNGDAPSVSPYGQDGRPALIIPLVFGNSLAVQSWGVELSATYIAARWLDLSASYSFIDLDVDIGESGDTSDRALIEGSSPRNQAMLKAHSELSDTVSVDGALRYVDNLSFGDVKAYVELDSQIVWKLSRQLQLAVVGRNLLHESHAEFQGNLFGPPRTELARSVFAVMTYSY